MDEFQWTTGNDSNISHESKIDSGSFGAVHKMRNLSNGQGFARKVLLKKEDALREVRAIKKLFGTGLIHNNLVAVIAHGELQGMPFYYIDMELCEGNLEEYIRGNPQKFEQYRNSRLLNLNSQDCRVGSIWDVVEQITSGIRFIHSCGEVHRDLKPRNVLFSARNCIWKVGDFGLTTEGTSYRARTTHYARGTACYRAPELLSELPVFSNKVDIFAIGCILYELVTGGKKAFPNDFFIHEYKSRDQLKFPFIDELQESWRIKFQSEIYSMLAPDRTDRPTSTYLCQIFSQNRAIAVGEYCMQRKDFLRSTNAFIEAAKEGPIDANIWKLLGDSHNALGEYKEAIKAYESAIMAGLSDSTVLSELGGAQHADGDYGRAISTYTLAIKKDPSNVNLWIRIGDSYISNKQYKEGIQILKKALRKSRDNKLLLEKLGNAYYASGNIEAAFKICPALKLAGNSRTGIVGSINDSKLIQNLPFPKVHHWPDKPSLTINIPTSPTQSPTSSEYSNLSGTSRHWAISQVDGVIDKYSEKIISTDTIIAAIEGHTPKHAEEMAITYGDLVVVKEIYQDGWATGIKLRKKIWEDDPLTLSEFQMENRTVHLPRSPRYENNQHSGSPQTYIFKLRHFCHFEVWKEHEGWTEEPPGLTSASPIESPQSEKSKWRKLGLIGGNSESIEQE